VKPVYSGAEGDRRGSSESSEDVPVTPLRCTEEVFIMTTIDATSEVFMTAFRALPRKAREAVVDKMLNDKEFREDLMDAAIIDQRRKEPSRLLEEYLSDRRKKG
jgi:hypothetical protein